MSTSPQNPLATPYVLSLGYSSELLQKLYDLRSLDIENGATVSINCGSRLRSTIRSTSADIVLREYQKQMIVHLTRMKRFICGDAVGLGKTLDTIAAGCWLKERLPKQKIVVLATKSTTYQWHDECRDFSELRPLVVKDSTSRGLKSYEARYKQFMDFFEKDDHDVIICKYTSMIGKRRKLEGQFDDDGNPVVGKREAVSQEIKLFSKIFREHRENIILVCDEAHKFKTPGTQIRNLVYNLQKQSARVWALTATAIKNNLEEFYAIAAAIGLQPLGSMSEFREDYCNYQDTYIGQGRYKPTLMGYKRVPEFRAAMRPFFLGRSQAQVKEPLPRLTTVWHDIDLDEATAKILLDDIPSGKFAIPPTVFKLAGEIYEKERKADNMMTMMSLYQMIANHVALLYKDTDRAKFLTKQLSTKEETLLDMLDGDFRGEKVIVFTKYRTWIDRLEEITKAGAFTERKFLRITGAENEEKRAVNKRLFQAPDGEHDLIVINSAAMEGVNLQQAAHMVLLDVPWSWGDLIQLVGRMVRMASPHSACQLHVMVAKGTVDEYAIETLKGKKGVFEKILGESHSAGILDEKEAYDLTSGLDKVGTDNEFTKMLSVHAKKIGMGKFLKGEKLAQAQADSGYVMAFENEPKKQGAMKFDDKWDFEEL